MRTRVSTPKIYMRNKRYYIRVQVPRDMQDVIGRKEYCISLGTSDYTVAQAKARDKTEQKRREISQQYARDMKRNRRVDWFSNDECHALKSKVFHSFRHNFTDAARQSGLHRDIAKALGGWEAGSTDAFDIYGSGYKLAVLHEELQKLDYLEVDWFHLIE